MNQTEASVESSYPYMQPLCASQGHKLSKLLYQTAMNFQHFVSHTDKFIGKDTY